jgi:hypothetical protein
MDRVRSKTSVSSSNGDTGFRLKVAPQRTKTLPAIPDDAVNWAKPFVLVNFLPTICLNHRSRSFAG